MRELSEEEGIKLAIVNGMRKKWGLSPYTPEEWIEHLSREELSNENSIA